MINDRTDRTGRGNTGQDRVTLREAGAPGAVSRRPRSARLNPLPIKAQRLPQQRARRWFSHRSQPVMRIEGAPVATSSQQMRREAY